MPLSNAWHHGVTGMFCMWCRQLVADKSPEFGGHTYMACAEELRRRRDELENALGSLLGPGSNAPVKE